ncbi:MAG: UvrD-helicase domain-containing protein [Calditerrivibrio sp.]|nr:UvrD-helicase domain-containing protein [Calditerrivibrio sp.]
MLDDLNQSQKDAVLYNDGPLLVIAGAGTGKTKVITHKIAYIIKELNIAPENILAMTFTNKAADEMSKRVTNLTGNRSRGIWIGTFHSIALKMLRRDGYLIDLPPNFGIIDQDDRISILRDILKNLNIDSKKYPPKIYLSSISNFKNTMEFVNEVNLSFDEYKFDEVFANYQSVLKSMSMIDFDDMLSLALRILKRFPEVKYFYKTLFKYILVDEFQDTNGIQLEFLINLSDSDGRVTAVGDDDQSIYGWRGAEIKNILNFDQYFPSVKIVKLVDNYRSGFNILHAANCLISNNRYRRVKELQSYKKEMGHVVIQCFENEIEEAAFVANKIQELVNLGVELNDIAILYRANAQSRNFEVELNNKRLPYKVIGSVGFYGRKEIKDILAFLRFYSNPYDIQSFKRAIKIPPRHIGDATIEKVSAFTLENGVDILTSIKELYNTFTDRVKKSFDEFIVLFDGFEHLKVSEMIKNIVDKIEYENFLSQYEDMYEVERRMDNINELINAAVQKEEDGELTLKDFLSDATLYTSNDEDATGFIKLMTIHSAKGLEFHTVFLTGLEEGVFPLYKAIDNDLEMEEERRLCYVGITRSKEMLFISHVNRRLFYGKPQILKPSPFIFEIKHNMIKSDIGYDRVSHEKFGDGKIIKIEGSGENSKVTVNFEHFGIKTIIAKFLKFYSSR